MNTFYVYLWTIVDHAREVMGVVSGFSAVGIFLVCLCSFLEKGDPFELCKGFRKAACIIGATCLILYTLTPSSKNLALIYVLPRIADSKVIQKDLPELYDIAISSLKNKLTNTVESVTK